MNDKMLEITKFYTAYMCAMVDICAEVKDAFGATDFKTLIEEVVTDIARAAYAAGTEEAWPPAKD